MKLSSVHLHSQTVRARELKFWEKVHLLPRVICHVSHAMCHVSCVPCHMSCVTCHVSHVFVFFGQRVGASRWRVFYQRGLPCLVYSCFVPRFDWPDAWSSCPVPYDRYNGLAPGCVGSTKPNHQFYPPLYTNMGTRSHPHCHNIQQTFVKEGLVDHQWHLIIQWQSPCQSFK